MNAFTAKPDDTAGKMIAAGNRLAAMLDTSLTAPVEQWPDEAEIDAALKEWRFAVDPCPLAAAGKGIDAPQPQPKPLFGDLIAQHPGLSEELAEMQAPKQEPVAVPEGWHIAKADNGQVLVSAPNCDPGSAWIKNQGQLPQRILYALVGAMLDAPQPQRDDTALLRQALEALEFAWRAMPGKWEIGNAAIAALRERLK
jgi:hypothetical protein